MTIIHVDMDMFFAAVEIRDNPKLAGKPLIIGALPHQRGVVATCSYEARRFGVRSAMSIKEAYRLCPQGIYMKPNGQKYIKASKQIHKIWATYSDQIEYISLDEGFIDVTATISLFGGAEKIAWEIKRRVKEETGLTCSVGLGYSMTAAKLASEEKKPDGFFQILTPEAFKELVSDRSVRILYGVGPKTAEELNKIGIFTVRDILNNKEIVAQQQGQHIIDMAEGIDPRKVLTPSKSHSFGKEQTFQEDTSDREYLKDVLRLIARDLSFQLRLDETLIKTITLKVTFKDMKKITRSKSGSVTNKAEDIYRVATELLDNVENRPIRLVGITLSNFSNNITTQLSLFDDTSEITETNPLDEVTINIQKKYGLDSVKTGSELISEKRLNTVPKEKE